MRLPRQNQQEQIMLWNRVLTTSNRNRPGRLRQSAGVLPWAFHFLRGRTPSFSFFLQTLLYHELSSNNPVGNSSPSPCPQGHSVLLMGCFVLPGTELGVGDSPQTEDLRRFFETNMLSSKTGLGMHTPELALVVSNKTR